MVFAYSPFVRALFWLAYRYLATFFVTHTPLYDKIYLGHDWRTASLTKKVEMDVRKLKADVRVKKRARLARQLMNEKARVEQEEEEEVRAKKAKADKDSSVSSHSPAGNGVPACPVAMNGQAAEPVQYGPGHAASTVMEEERPSSQRRPGPSAQDLEAQTSTPPVSPASSSLLRSLRTPTLTMAHTTPPERGRELLHSSADWPS